MTLKIGRAKKTVEEIERRSSRRHTDQKKRNGEYANPHRVDDTQPVAKKTNHKDRKKKKTPISGHHQTSAAKNRKPSRPLLVEFFQQPQGSKDAKGEKKNRLRRPGDGIEKHPREKSRRHFH